MKNLKNIFFVVALLLILFYFWLPVIQFGFYDLPLIVLLVLLILIVFSFRFKSESNYQKVSVTNAPSKKLLFSFFIALGLFIIIPLFTTATVLYTSRYQKLIGEVKNGEKISAQIAPIAMDKIRVVDQELAYLLGEKIIGSQPALGSQVVLGRFSIQKVNNEL